ncbi:MAG: hypothetical protein OHK0029_38980 [Armatimonadaceae bacterium]
MRSAIKTVLSAAALAGLLGASSLPMLRVWQEQQATPQVRPASLSLDSPISVPTEILVDLKDAASDAEINAVAEEYGLSLRPNSVTGEDNNLMRAIVSSGQKAREVLSRLKADSRVEAAETEQIYTITQTDSQVLLDGFRCGLAMAGEAQSDQVLLPGQDGMLPQFVSSATPSSGAYFGYSGADYVPNDPRYSEQWNFQMIGAESAWKRARGNGIVVAVIDTGVAAGPVKKGKPSRDFGNTKFIAGYDFVNDSADAWDDHGHGTHVAGTIAESTNNNEGVAGLAFEATIMPLKVLSAEGYGNSGDIADAIRFAADNGAHVINMSLGSAFPSDVIRKACQYAAKKGVVIVCAAGNGFGAPVGYPAAFPECIAVSAVGPTGDIAKYSSYGKEVALAAPGGDMVDSRDPKDGILQNTNFPESQGGRGDDYYAFQGTSMASPHVAAAAALVMSQGITDRARVKDVLVKSAVTKDDKNKYGAGILSVARATAKAEQLQGVKLRHVLAWALVLPLLFVGPRRRFGLRAAMLGGLLAGFYGPDLFSNWVGADSAWNLLTFSALLPAAGYALLKHGPAVKAAGAFALGVGVNLYANWHNGTLPFTEATFGEAAIPWTAVNLVLALAFGMFAARRAFLATNSVNSR